MVARNATNVSAFVLDSVSIIHRLQLVTLFQKLKKKLNINIIHTIHIIQPLQLATLFQKIKRKGK